MNPFDPTDTGNIDSPKDYGNITSQHTQEIEDLEWKINRLRDQYDTLNTNVNGIIATSNDLTSVQQTVFQANTFNAGQVIYYNLTTSLYELAKADSEATAEVCGVVTSADAAAFTFVSGGIIDITGLSFASGLCYWLSPTTAGALTTLKPLTVGHVQKPVIITLTGGAAAVVNMRGMLNELMIDQHVDTTSNVTHKSMIISDLTASTALVASATKGVTSSAVTSTELGYVSGVTSALQTQLNAITTKEDLNRTITEEPTGFLAPADVIINYDPATLKITLTGNTIAYFRGVVIAALSSGWVSTAHPSTTGHQYFLSYDGNAFSWADNTFPGYNKLVIAIVNYGATDKYAIRECHGLMAWQTHAELHQTIGCYKSSGGALAGVILDSTTATDRRPTITATTINDEDLPTVNPALTSALYTKYALTGAAVGAYTVETAEVIPLLTNNPYYNSFSTPNWGQTLFPANSLGSVWVYALPVTASVTSQKYRYLFVQPQWVTQSQNGSAGAKATALAAELARQPSELNLGTLTIDTPEIVLIGRIVVWFTTNWSIASMISISGTKLSQSGVPSGNFLSTVATDATLTGNGTVASPLTVTQSYVLNTGNETVAGVKTFSSFPVTPGSAPTTDYQVANKKYVADLDAANVKTTGNQSIAGNKTFTGTVFLATTTESIIGESWI
jgi:hypothetical protein